MTADPESTAFWVQSWARKRAESVFLSSQQASADRWQAFYDGMTERDAAVWVAMGDFGGRVADLFFRERVISSGQSVLDVGCGTGTLALPLSRMGARVLALDSSPGMLRILASAAAARPHDPVQICVGNFETFTTVSRFDLAVAACFPPALSPEGLTRLEDLSRGEAAVVVGTGAEAFPFRRDLWAAVMGGPLPSGRFHLAHLTGWLLASGRMPNLRHIGLDLELDHPPEDLAGFFIRYFAIFGKSDAEARRRIDRYFEGIAVRGRVRKQGRAAVAAVWWRAPNSGGAP